MHFVVEYGWVWLLSLGGFLLLWPISILRRDCSIVDFWWGPGFGVMALALWFQAGQPGDAYTLAILLPLLFWSLRLGIQLGVRRISEGVEDARYQEMREARSPGWGWKSLFIVFVLQSVIQGVMAAGVLAGLLAAPTVTATGLTYALAAVATAAAVLEMISDLQLDRYRRRVPHGGLLTTGLRAYVRYPSYTAEIVFWVALSLLAMAAGVWWAPISALIVTLLLRYVSGVTILEDRLSRTRPGFAAYQRSVPALWPRIGGGSGNRAGDPT